MNLIKKFKLSLVDLVIKSKYFSTSLISLYGGGGGGGSKQKNINLNKVLQSIKTEKMPRNGHHIADAQKQRMKIKERNAHFIPGTVNLVVVGSGSPGTPASVYLFTDQTRYLFNCGEGTQRLAHEYKTKLSRLEHIFMTQTKWQHIGGLPGLSLTVQDSGVPHLTLHGPAGLEEIFYAMRRFVVLKDLKVDAPICKFGDCYEDSVLTVNYIPIYKQTNDESDYQNIEPTFDDDIDYYAHELMKKRLKSPQRKIQWKTIQQREKNSIMCYVCKLKPRPGALCLEKCVDKGVPPGPLLGQLKNGKNVTLPNGNTVYASDVCEPDDPGPIFLVIDIPSIEYLENFNEIDEKYFRKYQSTATHESDVASLVIHFTPQSILESEVYRQFMNRFSPSTKHLIVNESNQFSGYLSAHRIQFQLNQLNTNVFPILREYYNQNSIDEFASASKKQKLNDISIKKINPSKIEVNQQWDLANSMTIYHLRPKKGIDRTSEQLIDSREYINEITNLPGFTESLESLKQQMNTEFHDSLNVHKQSYPKIIFLGTGSCVPNKTRNVSSILVFTSENSCILLDCGEGTAGQIIRFYGWEQSIDVFRKLKAIYVSHLHADHHIGLIGMLQMRRQLLNSIDKIPLLLLAPEQIQMWLHYYDQNIEKIKDQYHLISNSKLINSELTDEHLNYLQLNSIKTCFVKHCPYSYGVSMTFNRTLQKNPMTSDQETINNNEFKITYSGDTMPCNELIEIGKNSTILIHEATMEDELVAEAKMKMHSTLSQAIEQGEKMNAEYILLTHFSQRYAKLPRIDNVIGKNIAIAFDNMEITESDLKYLHLFYPTLKLLFAECCEEMEQKAIKRANKNHRLAELFATNGGGSTTTTTTPNQMLQIGNKQKQDNKKIVQ